MSNSESNAVFAHTDDNFKKACAEAEIPATRRQASKWRRGAGKAYKTRKANKNG
jgi:hypothetical protein